MAYSHSANYMNPNVVYVCVCACGLECGALCIHHTVFTESEGDCGVYAFCDLNWLSPGTSIFMHHVSSYEH